LLNPNTFEAIGLGDQIRSQASQLDSGSGFRDRGRSASVDVSGEVRVRAERRQDQDIVDEVVSEVERQLTREVSGGLLP